MKTNAFPQIGIQFHNDGNTNLVKKLRNNSEQKKNGNKIRGNCKIQLKYLEIIPENSQTLNLSQVHHDDGGNILIALIGRGQEHNAL